jgi:aromatic ring-opening dioxygenase LigB subunit
MSSIVFACIAPHGIPLIPALSPDAEGAMRTRAALRELEQRFTRARPDVVVIATPHGIRVDGAICLAAAGRAVGVLHWRERKVELNLPVDTRLTGAIAERAHSHNVPVALASFAANQREASSIPLDWGTIVPLWFLGHGRSLEGHGDVLADPPAHDTGPPIVIAAPSRSLPRTAMIDFGHTIAEAAGADGRRVAFVASCDWAHTHSADGPYGFHPAAAEVDALVVRALKANDLHRLIDLPEDKVQAAVVDGLWQALMLAGVVERTPMRGEVLSYEAPSYYGMIVAAFTPADG